MLLASGSKDNLKPELVVEAMCNEAGVPFNRYDYRIHRLETYMGGERGVTAAFRKWNEILMDVPQDVGSR
ncbi:MAG: hypothetical protein ACLUGQ_09455 [Coprococcus sp.]